MSWFNKLKDLAKKNEKYIEDTFNSLEKEYENVKKEVSIFETKLETFYNSFNFNLTDEYLQLTANSNRLKEEYEKYGSLVIAFDFDNTVYDFHKKGITYNNVIKLLQDLKEKNCTIICFTANEDHDFIKKYCTENKIPLDGININPPFFKGTSGKIYFNALLDDRAGLIQTYLELKHLIICTL